MENEGYSPAESPETKGVKVEYKFNGKYGEILGTGTDDNFDFPIPEGATDFDGYITTSYDRFAFQGPIGEAKELFNKVERLEKITVELQNIEIQLSVARAERNQKTIEELKSIKENILKEMDALELTTNSYKI